jgi:hypothetical protein
MKEHPILFSGEMVRAILEGRKTQTRRVVKWPKWIYDDYDKERCSEIINSNEYRSVVKRGNCDGIVGRMNCPYGAPGDVLYVRETWRGWVPDTTWMIRYKADDSVVQSDCDWDEGPQYNSPFDLGLEREPAKWRPSIFMPRWASRIQLRVVDVRVERLQKITDDDAKKEGCFFTDYGNRCFHPQPCPLPKKHPSHPIKNGWKAYETTSSDECLGTPRMAFANLWNSINKKRGYGWDENPWVWVVEFEVSKP